MSSFKSTRPQDLTQVYRALGEASEATRSRIVTVYGAEASGYVLPTLIYATLAAIAWTVVGLVMHVSLPLLVLGQLLAFVAVFAALFFTGLKVTLCPGFLRKLIVERAVTRLIRAHGLDQAPTADAEPSILLLVFRREGYAQIIACADAAKAVPPKIWRNLLDSLLIDLGHGEIARGMRNTVTAAAKLMSLYFPTTAASAAAGEAHGGHLGGNQLHLV